MLHESLCQSALAVQPLSLFHPSCIPLMLRLGLLELLSADSFCLESLSSTHLRLFFLAHSPGLLRPRVCPAKSEGSWKKKESMLLPDPDKKKNYFFPHCQRGCFNLRSKDEFFVSNGLSFIHTKNNGHFRHPLEHQWKPSQIMVRYIEIISVLYISLSLFLRWGKTYEGANL